MTDTVQRSLLISFLIILSLIASVSDSYYFLLLASAASACIFLYLICRLLQRGQLSRFLLLSSLSCGAWLSVGFVQSYLNFRDSEISVESFSRLFSSTSILISPSLYSLAFSFALAFILAVSIVAELAWLQRQEYKFRMILLSYLVQVPNSFYRVSLFLVSSALFFVSVSGLFAVRGLDEKYYSDAGNLPWWFAAVELLIGVLPLLIPLFLRRVVNSISIVDVTLLIYSFVIGLYFYVLRGRFGFLSYFLLLGGSALSLSNIRIRFTRALLVKSVIAFLILYALSPLVQATFAYINILRYQAGVTTTPFEILSDYLDFVASPVDVSSAIDRSTNNLAARPLVLWPLASSIQMWLDGTNISLIGFEDLVNSFLNALPRFFVPFKGSLFLQEDLLYSSFPFSSVDTADSPYLYAFASFGLAGLAVYPVAIFVVYSVALRISVEVGNSALALWPKRMFLLFATSQFFVFAILSYGELATTGLIRAFVVITLPALLLFLWLSLVQKRKSSI